MRLRLPKDPKAPLLARGFVRSALCEGHSREARDEVELLVSELVTNAVVHGGSLVTLDVECEGPDGIAVSVSDSSPAWPVVRRPGLMDEGGRGMELVELISDAWGVREAGLVVPGATPDGEPGGAADSAFGGAADGALGGAADSALGGAADSGVDGQVDGRGRPLASGLPRLPRQAQGKTVWFRVSG